MEFDSFVLAASVSNLEFDARVREYADAVEFRMDLAEEPLAQLRAYDGPLPVIATNRIAAEGGEAPAGQERRRVLRSATDVGAVEAVDLELSVVAEPHGRELLESVRAAGVETVVSTHDFEGTPSRDRMREQLLSASDLGTVGKLAVTATDRGGVLDLLAVTDELADERRRVATMAMGQKGRHSRAVAPLYGSVLGYAPPDAGTGTAPGQYDLATLAELRRRL